MPLRLYMAMGHSRIQSWKPSIAGHLKDSSIFFNYQTYTLFGIFFALRFLSFVLTGHQLIQGFVVFALIMILGIAYFKNQQYAWMIILGEIFLGGSGHFFEFFGLSVRTTLILTFLLLWIFFTLLNPERSAVLRLPHRIYTLFVPLFAIIMVSAIVGLVYGNPHDFVIQDLVPYIFLFLLMPSFHLFKSAKIQYFFVRLMLVFLIGSALFALMTFVMYSTEIAVLHQPFYQWFRDVAMGKITEITPFFYRIVLPEHLLIAPGVLIIMSLLMRDEKHHPMWRILYMFGALILALNLSRAYLLGLFAGTIILLYKHTFKRWIKEAVWAAAMFMLIFIGVNAISSGGSQFGLDILGLRASSLVDPSIEQSSTTRLALLPPIFDLIREHPVIGNGLGSTISYSDPITNNYTKTKHMDWGYLEMIAELGIVGLLYFLILVGFVLFEFYKKIYLSSDYHDFHVGLIAGFVSLMIINITTPALFHVFGIFYLIFMTAFIAKPLEAVNHLTIILYRIFNKITHR